MLYSARASGNVVNKGISHRKLMKFPLESGRTKSGRLARFGSPCLSRIQFPYRLEISLWEKGKSKNEYQKLLL